MTNENIAISVEGLMKSYGAVHAVQGISFSVARGGIFGFLGPNGAGKTTTINMLCTLLAPSAGRASVDGHDCATEPDKVRRSIGLVFQDTTLDKDLTAYENLSFHARLYSVPRSEVRPRVEEALRFVQLYDRRDDLVKKFSGGMKRRLEVARGLIHRPAVLFLDEPTLGLDPQSRANLWQYIVELPKRHGVTVFMTTHYMEEAEVCSRIAIIDHGKIIAEGSPAELKQSVGGDVVYLKTADNEAAAWTLKEKMSLEAVQGDTEVFITAEAGRAEALIPDIIRTLGGAVQSVRMQRPTLNDVFLKLTGKAIRDTEEGENDGIRSDVRAYRRRHGK